MHAWSRIGARAPPRFGGYGAGYPLDHVKQPITATCRSTGAVASAGSHRLAARIAVALVVALMVAACGAGSPSPRPSRSPVASSPPRSSELPTLGPPLTASPTVTPEQASDWPDGWDTAFCAAFEQVVIAQELVVDIGRALAEEARGDAHALASELIATAEAATPLLANVTGWGSGKALVGRLTSLVEIGGRIGRQYRRYLAEDRPAALERANELIGEMRPVVAEARGRLADLAQAGIVCPGSELTIDSP